ncbi:MAG: sigma factor-like helix-turn-helix DNA-binding protein, partial [Pseudomonadota bacterium]
MENVENVESSAADPETAALWRDEERAFFAALNELDPESRRAVRLHSIEELKIRDIAERMGISVGKAHRLVRDGLSYCEDKLNTFRSEDNSGGEQ